eukprot:TRINITY_DN22088_c0_g3_i1.p1 TRINITY_DN22088_c0_g3~~TRINITY_DN22088_c0_g3_i1.p1  ORF type:complete len:394 (+),score=81.76 TRINITY_DN22088_c0_g3_i1:116-1297(+)
MNFWSKYAFNAFLPGFLAVGTLMVMLLVRILQRKSPFLDQTVRSRFARVVGVVMITLHTSCISSAVSPFNCEEQPDQTFTLVKDPSITCFGSEWINHLWLIALVVIIYTSLVPIGMMLIFQKARTNQEGKGFMRNYDFLLAPYKPSHQYWELVLLLKRSAFVLSISFFSGASYATRFGIMISILLIFFWLTVFLSPYRDETLNIFDASWAIVCISTLMAQGLVFESSVEGTAMLEGFVIFMIVCCFVFNFVHVLKVVMDPKMKLTPEVFEKKLLSQEDVLELCNLFSLQQLEKNNGELCLNISKILETNKRCWIDNPFKMEHQNIVSFLKKAGDYDVTVWNANSPIRQDSGEFILSDTFRSTTNLLRQTTIRTSPDFNKTSTTFRSVHSQREF